MIPCQSAAIFDLKPGVSVDGNASVWGRDPGPVGDSVDDPPEAGVVFSVGCVPRVGLVRWIAAWEISVVAVVTGVVGIERCCGDAVDREPTAVKMPPATSIARSASPGTVAFWRGSVERRERTVISHAKIPWEAA